MGVDQVQKPELGLLAFFTRRTTRKVAADDGQLGSRLVKPQFNIPAFSIELGAAKAQNHVAGLMQRVDTDARVALFLGEVKVSFHACQRFKPVPHVVGLGLDLLHTNTIWCMSLQPGLQAFAVRRADAVEVEAGQFERGVSHGVWYRSSVSTTA